MRAANDLGVPPGRFLGCQVNSRRVNHPALQSSQPLPAAAGNDEEPKASLPQEFLSHGTRDEVLEEAGLTPQHLARQITEAVALRSPGDVSETATAATEGQPVE